MLPCSISAPGWTASESFTCQTPTDLAVSSHAVQEMWHVQKDLSACSEGL